MPVPFGVNRPTDFQNKAVYSLNNDWDIINSKRLEDSPKIISTKGFNIEGWNHCNLPRTEFASEITDGKIKDPFYGKNLMNCEGMSYDPSKLFCNEDFPEFSPYITPWYYRKEFFLQEVDNGKRIWLFFNGINYSANLWINGELIIGKDILKGTFRRFHFDVTGILKGSMKNVILLEIFPPSPTDLSISWADWNPYPPDKNAGIWQDIFLKITGDVLLEEPSVTSKMKKDRIEWEIQPRVFATNASSESKSIKVAFKITGEDFNVISEKTFSIQGKERKELVIESSEFPELRKRNPRLWWPWDMGEPYLYEMEISAYYESVLSDSEQIKFGIHDTSSQINETDDLLIKINGKPLLVLGAGWTPDIFLRRDYCYLENQFQAIIDMGLNCIRLEGKLDSDYLFDLADKYGIMVIAGWNCGDIWEKWDRWKEENYEVAYSSLEDQITRLRRHPSIILWMNGSDFHPPETVERRYIEIEKKLGWNSPIISSATAAPSDVSGPTHVKMTGPYDYVPPNYWYEAKDLGGAKGFLTEIGPGPSIPLKEELRKFIPEQNIWPLNETWNFHCGLHEFRNLNRFISLLEVRFGKLGSLDDFIWKSQFEQYETERAMFEAFVRNRYVSTGVIHWMLNGSWPNLIWHLISYYFIQNSSYFGVKKALEPIHIQYCYDNDAITVINRTPIQCSNLRVNALVYNINFKLIDSMEVELNVKEDSNADAFKIDKTKYQEYPVFIYLLLKDSNDSVVSRNFYLIPERNDQLDYSKTVFYQTPIKEFSSIKKINEVKRVKLDLSYRVNIKGNITNLTISLKNRSSGGALLTRIRVLNRLTNEEITPVFYSDNFVSVPPYENLEIYAHFKTSLILPDEMGVGLDGFNVEPKII